MNRNKYKDMSAISELREISRQLKESCLINLKATEHTSRMIEAMKEELAGRPQIFPKLNRNNEPKLGLVVPFRKSS